MRPQHHLLTVLQMCSKFSCSNVGKVWLHVLQTKAGSDPAARAFVGLLVHSAAGEHRFFSLESLSCLAASVFCWLLSWLKPSLCLRSTQQQDNIKCYRHACNQQADYHYSGQAQGRNARGNFLDLTCCIADGFAVGAASRSSSSSLGLTIAVAMVLHKAPVAFGLATSFMTAKWTWQKSQRALLAFSSASPISAVLTYALIGAIPALSSASSTALCVLFSGGTFLYAACMHILPEVVGHDASLSTVQLGAVLCGSILPLLLTLATPHAH